MSEQQAEHSEKEVEQPATTEDVQPEKEAPQNDDGGDESAAFESAFASTRGDNTAAPHRDAAKKDKAAEQQADAPVTDAVEEAQNALAGLSDTQMKDLLSRVPEIERNVQSQLQKITGKMGEFNRTIQELRQMQASGRPADQSAARQIASDMLTRTRSVFPEMADAIAEDLNKIFAAPVQQKDDATKQPQGLTQEQVAQFTQARISEATGQMQRQYELKLLTLQHPDWQKVASTPDFRLWADTLPAEDKDKLFGSEDAVYVSEKLGAYKAFRKQQTDKSATRTEQSRRRLEQAVTPTSGATQSRAPAQTEEDAFLAGFARTRGG